MAFWIERMVWMAEGVEGGEAAPAPAAEPASPAPSGGGTEGAVESPGDGGAPPAPTPVAAKPRPDWRDARIATLTGRLRQTQEELARANGQPAATPPAAGAASPTAPASTAAVVPAAEIERQAAEIVAKRAFDDKCNAEAAVGKQAFGEAAFNERVAALKTLVDPTDGESIGRYNTLLEAAIETGQGHKILHELGGDPNRAFELMRMSPVKLGLEMAKLAGPQAVVETNAPKPITPVGQRAPSTHPIDPRDPTRAAQLSTAEWMKRREAQVAERRKAEMGG
jgi:hypothetical protein